jgi:hypothetical protein
MQLAHPKSNTLKHHVLEPQPLFGSIHTETLPALVKLVVIKAMCGRRV